MGNAARADLDAGRNDRRRDGSTTAVTIISDVPDAPGWSPILHMQHRLAAMLGADFHDISGQGSNRLHSILYSFVRRKMASDDRVAICIAPTAYHARKFVRAMSELGGFSRAVLWIVDSFWTEATQRERRLIDLNFDLVCYMQAYDEGFYRALFGDKILRLEWGSDVLDLGTDTPDRSIDLLRIGRQPGRWDDDGETREACLRRGLRFAGRPPIVPPYRDLSVGLMHRHYSDTRFVLAHSNVVEPKGNVHPGKAYVTGRWMDALACGATVAGVPPQGDLSLLDWPEALLPFPTTDREGGLELVAAAMAAWRPEIARRNHAGALRRLDWRWRFEALADRLELDAPILTEELRRLQDRVMSLGRPSAARAS